MPPGGGSESLPAGLTGSLLAGSWGALRASLGHAGFWGPVVCGTHAAGLGWMG